MPLYEYQCKSCGHRFEKIQSFSAPEEKVCPACGGEVERLISAPAIQFKGAGWYVNDYAGKSSPPKGSSSESKDAGKPEAKSAGKTDASAASSSGTGSSASGSSTSGAGSGSGSGSTSS